jgi:heme/copper-type cytochrome/quinol oxidase subunit 3
MSALPPTTSPPLTSSPPVFQPPPALDVSSLPESAFDWRDPVWWGNTLLILIETTTMSLAFASYFYLRRNFNESFPPPKVDVVPPIYNTAPDLKIGTIQLAIIVLTCLPMYITDVWARKKMRGGVIAGLVFMFVVGVVTTLFRFIELRGLHPEELHRWHLSFLSFLQSGGVYFWWNDNAYASIVWLILGLHLTYLLAATLEFLIMGAWVITHELDDHHALDVTLAGGYWYWVALMYLLTYGVVYFGPRLMRAG